MLAISSLSGFLTRMEGSLPATNVCVGWGAKDLESTFMSRTGQMIGGCSGCSPFIRPGDVVWSVETWNLLFTQPDYRADLVARNWQRRGCGVRPTRQLINYRLMESARGEGGSRDGDARGRGRDCL